MKDSSEIIDTEFDFRADTPAGKDPDTYSPTLCRYHQLLWSKPLPSGDVFELAHKGAPFYHYHNSSLGEFWLSSDTVIPSFWRKKKIAHIIEQIPKDDLDRFNTLGYTIGGMMLFPGKRINMKMTINAARGCHPHIQDRFDLTVECIRRYYQNESSPLHDTFERYADYFRLFGNFRNYVSFFLLEDIVNED